MYVIVVGAGKIGFYLTRELLSASHEVALIERDVLVSAVAAEEFGSIVITSDGTEPTVLGEAGAERCDILISTTGQDATNLTACQVARYSFKVPKTMAVVTDPDHVPLFRALGVDVTISTTELILSHVEEELTGGPSYTCCRSAARRAASSPCVCRAVPPWWVSPCPVSDCHRAPC